MAIPVQCACCRTLSELPDHFGGKTVRCSVCQAPICIRRPFGWGVKPAAPPSPPARAPLVVDAVQTSLPPTPSSLDDPPPREIERRIEDDDDPDNRPRFRRYRSRPASRPIRRRRYSGQSFGPLGVAVFVLLLL